MFTSAPWPRAAVFDCDGLLVDSGGSWRRVYDAIAARRRCSLREGDLQPLVGASVPQATRYLVEELGVDVTAEEIEEALLHDVVRRPPAPLPGAHALVAQLASRMPLAVASNGPRRVVVAMLQAARLDVYMSELVTADDVAAPKPDGDVYRHACRLLRVDPSDAIAFEDSPVGGRAVRAAGLFLVGVSASGADVICADLAAPRLDHPNVWRFLGLDRAGGARPWTPFC